MSVRTGRTYRCDMCGAEATAEMHVGWCFLRQAHPGFPRDGEVAMDLCPKCSDMLTKTIERYATTHGAGDER